MISIDKISIIELILNNSLVLMSARLTRAGSSILDLSDDSASLIADA
jgi:hypothetical protein